MVFMKDSKSKALKNAMHYEIYSNEKGVKRILK
jgi:hypothetical protein